MEARSSRLVVLGAAVLIVGAGLLFVGLSGDGAGTPASPASTPTPAATTEPGTRIMVQGAAEVPVIAIPKRHEAVAVSLPFVAGLAGYASAGDTINIYAAVKGGEGNGGLEAPYARLIIKDVEILDVRGGEGADPTFLLALKTPEVERLVFYSSFETMWASLAEGVNDAGPARGVDHGTVVVP